MANPVYPARNNAEAIALNISNANQFFTVLQGDIDDSIPTYEGNGDIPSVAKALNEAAAYRVPLPWQTTGEETNLMQPYEYDNNVYVPISVPAPFSTIPDETFWRLYSIRSLYDVVSESYFTGIEITQYNQVIKDGDFYWQVSPGTALPYTTTGAGMPEGGAFVAVGDAVLRQDLSDPDKGAAMVAYQGGSVADKLDEIVSGAVTEPIVDAKVLAHNHEPSAHPELRSSIISDVSVNVAAEADRAEAAADAAFVNADAYPDIATGRAAVLDGEQFQVVSGDAIIRYRRDSATTQTEVARYPSANLVNRVRSEAARESEILERSTNLAPREGELQGKVIEASGDIVDHIDYNCTDFIPVMPGTEYVSHTYNGVAEYSASKTFLRRKQPSGMPIGTSWEASSDAYFVRLNYQPARADSDLRRINIGNTLLPYEPYSISILEERLPQIDGAKLKAGSITSREVNFLKIGANLYNPETVTVGKVILASGDIVDNVDYSTTDYISVEPGGTYSKSGAEGVIFALISQYDENFQFISRTSITTVETITLSSSCYFVRLSFQGPVSAERMFHKGSEPLPYEPYIVELAGVSVGGNVNPLDRFMPDVPLEGIFSGVDYSSIWPEYATSITAAAVYQKYDELMAEFPEYISKQVLGEDDFGYTISAYHLSPGWPNSSFNDLKRPKIFITAGTHGYESIPPLACYLTFRDMLERWQEDPLLEALKYNADYIIIPVVNPSGFDDYTRQNRNGVDINRNFPEGWSLGTVGSGTYGGPEPLSEPEAQLVSQIFDENPDISICYDFHNFSGPLTNDPFIWIPTGQGRYVQHMASNLVSSLTRKWRKEYPAWFPQNEDYFAGYTDGTSGAMIQDHARGRGIKYAATFEVCGRWWVDPNTQPFDATHRTTMVEAWANWLLINLRELRRNLN